MEVSQEAIDTFNEFMVTLVHEKVVMLRPPILPLSKEQSFRLVGWILAMTCWSVEDKAQFARVLEAIENT